MPVGLNNIRAAMPAASPRARPPAAPLLAIDAAGPACSVALALAGETRARRSVRAARGHSGILMPMIEDVLAEAGIGYREIDCLAVTVGPGSFTGIRTALAAARGLALALDRPLIGVTTLEAVARAALRAAPGGGADCLAVLDTGRADVYAQRFAPDGAARAEPVATMPEALAAALGAGPLLLAGDAAAAVAPLLEARGVGFRGPVGDGVADAAIVAAIAAGRRCSASAGEAPRPLYLRPPDAVKPLGGGRLRP